MPKHALVMTVGVGGKNLESLLGALHKSIANARPDILGLVFSQGSHSQADQLKLKADSSIQVVTLEVSDPDDADKTFLEILAFIRHLVRDYGCAPETLQVDFTSGTKALSAGAVLAAVAAGVDQIRYVSGERRDGVVQAGMEKILTLSPVRIVAQSKIRDAISHLRHLRYSACLAILETIPNQALLVEDRDTAEALADLARAYQAWDLFRHQEALEIFRKTSDSMWGEHTRTLIPFKIPKEHFGILAQLVQHLKNEGKPQFSKEVRADLWNNAQRRIHEGKYDDAVARLYRLTEMCAQAALQAHNINTEQVREDQVPREHRSKYEFTTVNGRRVAKLGLQKAFELLRDLDDPLGEHVQLNSPIGQLLSERNKSILAHGTSPISKEVCLALGKEIHGLLIKMDPSFDQRASELQFPWLRVEVN